LNGGLTVRAWRALRGGEDVAAPRPERDVAQPSAHRRGRRQALARALRRRALAGAFPLAVAALNRAGLGPLHADLSSGELRRAGLRAMGDVAARLGLGDAHVVFGHTHRAGPLPADAAHEWRSPAGARLVNCGCWTYDAHFLGAAPGESPYWPGGCVVVETEGAPLLRGLLSTASHGELAPSARAPAALAGVS